MSALEKIGLAALRQIDPETAHTLALRALRAGLAPLPGPVTLVPVCSVNWIAPMSVSMKVLLMTLSVKVGHL